MTMLTQPSIGAAPRQRPQRDFLGIGEAAADPIRRSAPALVAGRRRYSFVQLDAALARIAEQLDPAGTGTRCLVAIAAENTPSCVLVLLAAVRAGHVVLLAPPCRLDDVSAGYDPDIVVRDGAIAARRTGSAHQLHPDLALLLSTSGSTGSPKLVRLSRANLEANARAIADSLCLGPGDRAITTLSPGYSYGLSVLTSHLTAGAAVVLNGDSVTLPGFWRRARRERVTTIAGVPHTFELLERAGFSGDELPSLRLITCAGGRLDPGRARRLARLGQAHGWDLAIMYGATEATARMACLPPALTERFADTVGRAIPGGSFRIVDPDERGVGRLAYRGPNVMMGYATSRADLARGRDLSELLTEDRARITTTGLVQIVGRESAFAKVCGLRLATDEVERQLAAAGFEAVCVAVDESHLGVVAARFDGRRHDDDPLRVQQAITAATGLPPAAVKLVIHEVPRLASGKPDRSAAAAMIRASLAEPGRQPCSDPPLEALVAGFSRLLGRPASPHDSFATLRGDSLSYVAVSVVVEQTLGHLPRQWHLSSLRDLARLARDHDAAPAQQRPDGSDRHRVWPGWAQLRQVDLSVLLRAIAIICIVGSHTGALDLRGGAHVLIALVGFNLARFQLAERDLSRRMRCMGRSAAAILVPSLIWVALLAALTGTYTWAVLGVNALISPTTDTPDWRYWFVEALLWILPAVVLALRLPWLERVRCRYPFWAPAGATVVAWSAAAVIVPDARPSSLFAPLAVLWVFLLGWAMAAARTRTELVAATAMVVVLVPGAFESNRMLTVPMALLLLIWVSRVTVPAAIVTAAALVAEASLVIFLTHWQILEVMTGWQALAVSVLVGIAISRCWAPVRQAQCRALVAGRRGVGGRLRRPLPRGAEPVGSGRLRELHPSVS